jgi:hypothetical protein
MESTRNEHDLQAMSTLSQPIQTLQDEALARKYKESKRYMMKKYNFNEYGRYRGGYPNMDNNWRGTAGGEPGEFHDIVELRDFERVDTQTDLKINRTDVAEYGRYMQDDMTIILNKRTYMAGKIDENYFNLGQFSFFGKLLVFMVGVSVVRGLVLHLNELYLSKPRKGQKTLSIG